MIDQFSQVANCCRKLLATSDTMNETLRIGDVAEMFGITPKTLRHYEKLGLVVPEREENGYRLYSAENILRITHIRSLQALGLTLRQIKAILDDDTDGSFLQRILQSLLVDTEAELAALSERKQRIEELLNEQPVVDAISTLIVTPNGVSSYLAEHLPAPLLAEWRRDQAVYAQVGDLLTPLHLRVHAPVTVSIGVPIIGRWQEQPLVQLDPYRY